MYQALFLHAGYEATGFGTAVLKSTTSECLLRVRWYFVCIVAGLVCFAATIYTKHYFCGKQTVENHLIHTGTNSYHIMTSSIPSWFIFSQFIFSRKQVCLRKSQKFSPSENFPLYGIMYMYYQKHRYRQFFIGLHSKLTSG